MFEDPEYLALFDTVLGNPKDDAPRWIISDWLEEHDQLLLAEFIRFQLKTGLLLDQSIRRNHHFFSQFDEFTRFQLLTDPELFNAVMFGVQNKEIGVPEVIQIRTQSQQFWQANSSPSNLPNLFRKSLPQSLDWRISPITIHHHAAGANAIIVRGFIQAVQLTMANFMIHAFELFRRHPIQIVKIPDKHPGIADDDISKGFGWIYSNNWTDPDELNALPREIYDCLPKSMIDLPPSVMPRWEDETRAYGALRQACVNYGRKLAGLPPIKVYPDI